ncbi:MAG: ferritin family protein [Candidatus Aenigmarchaeota archaeon]|nr:ferritin family protein [Candidatus Aenigmarchaeota archaeon]
MALDDKDLMEVEPDFNPNPGDFSNERKVLQVALENEMKGRRLYMTYARSLTSDLAKRVFVHLANEELAHIEDIKAFIKSFSLGPGVDVDRMIKPGSLDHTKEFFGRLMEGLREQVRPSDDDSKSREVAMKIERAGYEYYKKGAETTKDKQLERFFRWLMEQEKAHYMLIRNAFEYMENPDSFFAGEEHWILEG